MKISVALCTYNGEKHITQQLESIVKQTVVPHEIIICDDNSSDTTIEKIKNTFEAHSFTDYRIEINSPGLKTIKNFEKAVSMCTGDWIFLSDQDDIWDQNKVETLLNAIQKNTLLLFTNGRLIDEYGNDMKSDLWHHWGFTEQQKKKWKNNQLAFNDLITNKNYVTGATAVLSKKLLKNALPIIVHNGFYHDAWFALHAAARNGLHFFDGNKISYRIHPQQQFGVSMDGKDVTSSFSEENISSNEFRSRIIEKYRKKGLNYQFVIFKNNLGKKINFFLKRCTRKLFNR